MILRGANTGICALAFRFPLAYSFRLYVASFIYGVFLTVLWFQMRVSLWFMWFPHVRGRLRSSDSLAWRWNTWQVL